MKPSANPKRTLIESLQVGLAWDSQIKDWAERELPNGEVVGRVKNAQTVNYKTLKPVKDGLFCEKIFGPTKDFECACGFKQTRGGFCPQCNVEFTRSEVRRYRLGYFQLPSAVTHVWYLRGRPSYISYLLGIKIKKALALTYGAASLLVNIQNQQVISQKENESFTFSFTTQTLYNSGECKGKTVPRGQIRRYNSDHFLFNKKRAKFIKNLFHSFIYTSCAKTPPSFFEHFAKENSEKKDKKDSIFSYSQTENLKSSFLSNELHDPSTNSYITKPFLFSSTIRGGWQPLIVVNLQEKLPVHLSYKKAHFKYYKFKQYSKFLQSIGFYTPSIFAKKKEGIQDLCFSQSENQDIQDLLRQKRHAIFKSSFFARQSQIESSFLVKTNWSDGTLEIPNGNGMLNNKHTDKDTMPIDTNQNVHLTFQNGEETNFCLDKKKTKCFFDKLILLNKQKKVKKFLVGINKDKEFSLSTLIFYPIKKKIKKIEESERLVESSSQLNKRFYQELDLKFKSLNYGEKSTKQIGLSPLPEKKVNLEHEFEETKFIFQYSDPVLQNANSNEKSKLEHVFDPKQNLPFSQEKLTNFRSLFHFIGQPCRLKKKSRFLVYTASNFSQTRNQIFKILEKEKTINSVDFSNKLSDYDKDLKEKYRILNSNRKKEYHQNHLFPYLFCLSCQSKNYQYLQTYSNFFIPIPSNSEKTLFVSSYKNPTRKNQLLNLYNSFLKDKFTITTLFSCFDNSSTVDLKHLTSSLAMRPLTDYSAERNEIETLENFVEEDRSQEISNNKFNEKNGNSSKGKMFGKEDKFKSEEILELQNSKFLQSKDQVSEHFGKQNVRETNFLRDTNIEQDQINDILGEIPLVLDLCEDITEYGKKSSKLFQQKKKILQNKIYIFWKLRNQTKRLQDKDLENSYFAELNKRGQNLKNKLNASQEGAKHESKLKAIDFAPQNNNFSGLFSKSTKKETKQTKKKDLLIQNSKLQERSLPRIFSKVNKDLPLFLQNISINSFFNSSKDQKFFRGFIIKNSFFIKTKPPFFKTDASFKQRLKETHQPILSFYEGKSLFDKNHRNFQEKDFFKNFAEQNFPFGWKSRQQTKKILKIAKISENFKKIRLSPISSNKWSYLSKKVNKEDYLFSIYEISVQQALGYTCGEAILKLLSPIDCCQLESGLKVVLWQINERISEVEDQGFLLKSDIILLNSLRTKKSRTLRRLKIAKILRKTKVLPKQMVFSLLPVLPPSLRPIIQLDENIVAVSDCSQIYQKIVQRSNRLSKRMSKYLSYDHCLRLKVLLQQAVDGLIENGKGGSKPLCDNNGRPLKSLSDGLKGKKGRFRQDLLGRRVDYSGRSVIVVGPSLKLHQCGLPREMAIELFQPFLIRQLFAKKIVSNIAVAKNYIKKETPIVLEILKQLLRSHPVLLNRAPTLHRLGVQAFQPKLVSGRAILLHPLVCSAFNADFDGDQMAVHIPLSSKARGEAWKILWSRNNILSPATGQPILVPSQDMVLGCYYLTTKKVRRGQKWTGLFFNNSYQVLKDLQQKRLKLHTSIWLKMNRDVEIHKEQQKPIEVRINCSGTFTKIYPGYLRRFYKKEGLFSNENKVKREEDLYVRTTCGRVMLNQTISPILHQPF